MADTAAETNTDTAAETNTEIDSTATNEGKEETVAMKDDGEEDPDSDDSDSDDEGLPKLAPLEEAVKERPTDYEVLVQYVGSKEPTYANVRVQHNVDKVQLSVY